MKKSISLAIIFIMLIAMFMPKVSKAASAARVQVIMSEFANNLGGTFTFTGGELDGSEDYNSTVSPFVYFDDDVTLTVTPDEFHRFIGWYNAEEYDINGQGLMGWRAVGDVLSTESTYTFTATEPYYNIMPVFELNVGHNNIWKTGDGQVTVLYENRNEEQETLDGEHWGDGEVVDYWIGDSITVKAKANEGSHFVGWFVTDPAASDPANYVRTPVVSAEENFTYKPGVTTIDGVEEPLNYLTAVFEEDEEVVEEAEEEEPEEEETSMSVKAGDSIALWVSLTVLGLAIMVRFMKK